MEDRAAVDAARPLPFLVHLPLHPQPPFAMSERPDRGDSRRRRRSRRRKSTPPSAEPEKRGDAADAEPAPRTPPKKRSNDREDRSAEPVVLKSPKVLERLRTRVEAAAEEIERLRRENAALTARVGELERRPAVDDSATHLLFDEDAETLQEKVTAFIEAIDHYLATEADRSDADAE